MVATSRFAHWTPFTTARWFAVRGVSVELRGELDLGAAPLISAAISAGIAAGRRHFVIDLGRATFLDCACLGAIVAGMAPLRRHDAATLGFAGATGTVEQLITLLDLDQVCSIVGSVDAAKRPAVDSPNACLEGWRATERIAVSAGAARPYEHRDGGGDDELSA
jgi:anti-anti-sigma factor